jgi:hypothetical protein
LPKVITTFHGVARNCGLTKPRPVDNDQMLKMVSGNTARSKSDAPLLRTRESASGFGRTKWSMVNPADAARKSINVAVALMRWAP